jgi:hypothetical protein
VTRAVESFIGLPPPPSPPAPQPLARGVLAADLNPANACDLCGRVQAAQATAQIVSRAGSASDAQVVAVNGSAAPPQLRNITADALQRAAVLGTLTDFVCGALPAAAAFSSPFCGSAVLDVLSDARGATLRTLTDNPAFALTEALVEACTPVLTAAAAATQALPACSAKCSAALAAAKVGLGCCLGFVSAALLAPIVGLAVDGKGRGTLKPATLAALDALVAAVNRTGGGAAAALQVNFAGALKASCGLSLAPCEAKTPSTLVSRVAGVNYAWVAASPARAVAFSAAFTADLAAALFVPPRMLNVTGLASGSVIVSTQAGGASSKFSSDLVKSAALVLDSPSFAFMNVLTLVEPDRANALSGLLANGGVIGAGSSNSAGGSAAGGGTVGGAVDLGNVTSTSPTTTTTSVNAASGDSSSAANSSDSATSAATATSAVVGAVFGAAALLGVAFVIRVRSRRPAPPPRSGIFAVGAGDGGGRRQSLGQVGVDNVFRQPAVAPLVVGGTPRPQRIVFAPTLGV